MVYQMLFSFTDDTFLLIGTTGRSCINAPASACMERLSAQADCYVVKSLSLVRKKHILVANNNM